MVSEIVQRYAEDDATDAKRYRWLRKRIQVRNMAAVSGSRRPALDVRLGWAFIDSHGPIATSKSLEAYEAEYRDLDQAISAALTADGGEKHE